DGTLRWQAPKSTLWGQRPGSTEDPADPGLAFAGQYRDTESGLCYNRFRYYDPTGGCYVSPDPIGVLGGESNYGYVPNPNTWIDPLGLAKCPLPSKVNLTRDGSRFVYEKTLLKIIGRTPEGEALTKVRVVVESNGDLVTAFSQSVFRDVK
ncbi:RHS repeat-associated core domain-containing protein, partial [Pectobacterium polaris]|uniref:RHS repeat-associated core domain-containing protein n=1 Tax=Pectobacterium polaris TaxID=2042057 RepID=UPI0023513333